MFITLEGIDGAGKSTLSRMLGDELKEMGHGVYLTKEPTGGIMWDEAMRSGRDVKSALMLFFRFTEDRYSHQAEIREHLEAGEIVICDRYLMSSLAYQGALLEDIFGDREKTVEWMLGVSGIITVRPDLTLYIDIDPKVSMERLNSSRPSLSGFEEAGYLNRVREFYGAINLPGKATIDGSPGIKAVFGKIMDEVSRALRQ